MQHNDVMIQDAVPLQARIFLISSLENKFTNVYKRPRSVCMIDVNSYGYLSKWGMIEHIQTKTLSGIFEHHPF
jgi:hypothetical protein